MTASPLLVPVVRNVLPETDADPRVDVVTRGNSAMSPVGVVGARLPA